MKQKSRIIEFVDHWKDHGYEKGEMQLFWIELLQNIFDVKNISDFIKFEQQINGKFIDAMIPSTNVLIEQKSIDKNLEKAYQQAKNYDNELPYDKKSRWIITCDFQQFQIYDMNVTKNPPKVIFLKDLPQRIDELRFLVDSEFIPIVEISLKAGELTKKIRKLLLDNYKTPSEENIISTNQLCTRLVFCLYADSAGIFKPFQFKNYLNPINESISRQGLIDLFNVLSTPVNERDKELDDILAEFPYVNGNLFNEKISIPKITSDIKYYLFAVPTDLPYFNWSLINPTIYGSLFESTLALTTKKKTYKYKDRKEEEKNIRREGGIHYTSVENIHKLIDPLFLDELKAEFENCNGDREELLTLQEKLSKLTFLDPACGSGNFLTETYLSLRKLENKILQKLGDSEIKVSIDQFYGIEINDFAASLAKVALWIAERQMMQETSEIINKKLEFLPIRTAPHIETANALRVEWARTDYIIGNPPFIGKKEQSDIQKADTKKIFNSAKGCGNLDYVSNWYFKAIEHMKNTKIKAAFISTNSITQGEQVPILWSHLLNRDINLIFAHRTFKWRNESKYKAAVHCVIIGFVYGNYNGEKKIFDDGNVYIVKNINTYLFNAPNIFIDSRPKPICEVKKMYYGNMPIDKNYLILSDEDVQTLLKENQDNESFIKKYIGGEELIYSRFNHCLWLKDISPHLYRKSKFIMERIQKTKIFRENSPRPQTKELANTPYLFGEIRQPNTKMLAIPKVSSENRRYIPMKFIEPEIIVSGSLLFIPNADLFDFGILMSNVHNAWTRAVCGRLEMRYQYSASIVYNNFVWCNPTEQQKRAIEKTAQGILDARALYPDSSLADLYDINSMKEELLKAHKENDKAVMKAYNFDLKMTEAEIVAELMKMYQKLTKN